MVRSLGLASQQEWGAWRKEAMRPPNVHSHPRTAYTHDGWEGLGHWLATGNTHAKQFLPFGEALAVARSLGLAGRTGWRAWCSEEMRPPSVPYNPHDVYKHGGWQGWGHWLGGDRQPSWRQQA